MPIEHDVLVAFSKSFGLLYLMAMAVAALAYALWPSNKARFERAANAILEGEDKPCR